MPPVTFENLDALNDFVGREIATTDWFEITQERIRQFAEVTEDRQWIHLDPDRAQRESPYAATIAHGFLTLSLLSHLSRQAFEIQDGVGHDRELRFEPGALSRRRFMQVQKFAPASPCSR